MRQLPILVTRPDGTIFAENPAAFELLGAVGGHRCHEAVRADNAKGQRVCSAACATSTQEGGQRDAGAVKVRGMDARMICSVVGDQRVITMVPSAPVGAATETLTPREREVLSLVARGLTSHRIARRLGLSLATVRTHVEHAREKMNARSRSQAVARAMALGQLD